MEPVKCVDTQSVGRAFCADQTAHHVFGGFLPFEPDTQWVRIEGWRFISRQQTCERLLSLRTSVFSSVRSVTEPVPPLSNCDLEKGCALAKGLLRLRVVAIRAGHEAQCFFLSPGSGLDLHAEALVVELYAPRTMRIATRDNPGGFLADGDVLDEQIHPRVSSIGEAVRTKGTLHTYIRAGEVAEIPPYACGFRFSDPGANVDGLVGGVTVPFSPQGNPGGLTGIRSNVDGIGTWEIAP